MEIKCIFVFNLCEEITACRRSGTQIMAWSLLLASWMGKITYTRCTFRQWWIHHYQIDPNVSLLLNKYVHLFMLNWILFLDDAKITIVAIDMTVVASNELRLTLNFSVSFSFVHHFISFNCRLRRITIRGFRFFF